MAKLLCPDCEKEITVGGVCLYCQVVKGRESAKRMELAAQQGVTIVGHGGPIKAAACCFRQEQYAKRKDAKDRFQPCQQMATQGLLITTGEAEIDLNLCRRHAGEVISALLGGIIDEQ